MGSDVAVVRCSPPLRACGRDRNCIATRRVGEFTHCRDANQETKNPMNDSRDIWQLVDAKQDALIALSDRVWATPELCYAETRSAAEHAAELERHGFRITRGVAGIPTAMIGEAGDGGPVIAILGEFDALPGLSQEAGITEPRPLENGGNGHGCGHNLLGA